ncbi:hypothetical protein PoB_007632800 [Plakobranchus ocellatus]|uniref:Uncharacterized protein n=1 Tax=Plakobranchus ocellatus TaxID=259542 RepID=A0AAV4E0C9_9GAST|nr:hypothetical protein PoB_007632800 [Plakobranchus ocellatus]
MQKDKEVGRKEGGRWGRLTEPDPSRRTGIVTNRHRGTNVHVRAQTATKKTHLNQNERRYAEKHTGEETRECGRYTAVNLASPPHPPGHKNKKKERERREKYISRPIERHKVTNSSRGVSPYPRGRGLPPCKKIKRWEEKRVGGGEGSLSLTDRNGQVSLPIATAELMCMYARKR